MENDEVVVYGEESDFDKPVADFVEVEETADKVVEELESDLAKISQVSNDKPNKVIPPKPKVSEKEINEMSESDLMTIANNEIRDLYKSFNEFLEQKTDLREDIGIKQVIPTGIDLVDAMLGGGFAVGSMGILVGCPGSGKSMLAMQTLGSAQRKFKGKVLASFLDAEQSTTTQRLSNLGVRNPKIRPYSDITIEKVFSFLEGTCVHKEQSGIIDIPSVVVWDSIANTLSKKEQEVDDINSTIGLKARILSKLLPKYIAKCAKYNVCVLAVNQLRDLISIDRYHPASNDLKFMSSSKDMPAGNAIKYNAFHLVELKVRGITDIDKHGFNGIMVSAKCVKNKLFAPNIEISLVGDFVHGFSNFWTNYTYLVNVKRIQASAWNTLQGCPKKFRTKDAYLTYKNDPEFKEAFDIQVKEAMDDFRREHEFTEE